MSSAAEGHRDTAGWRPLSALRSWAGQPRNEVLDWSLSIRVSTVPSQVCVGSKPGCRVPPNESVRETMRCFVVP
jgi:hypothetical protein